MRRLTLALWVVPCALLSALAGAGAMHFGLGPIGFGVLAFGIIAPVSFIVILARRADKKSLADYRKLGHATGCLVDEKLGETALVRAIIAGLCQRIERGASYKSVLMALPFPALIADALGQVEFANDALKKIAPELSAGNNLFASHPSCAPNQNAGDRIIILDRRPFAIKAAHVDDGQTVFGFMDNQNTISAQHLQKFADALTSEFGNTLYSPQEMATYPGLFVLNECFERLSSGLNEFEALIGDAHTLKGGLSGKTSHIKDYVSALTERGALEGERRGVLEQKLGEIARLIDLYKAAADRVGDMAEQAHHEGLDLKQVFDSGQVDATEIDDLSAKAAQYIDRAADAAQRTTAAISELARLTAQIDDMTSKIEDVSFRTNLLALNAAVEAARAGDKGAGFAVVADEVRTLAQVSSKSAKEIRALAAEGRGQSVEGSEGAQGLGELITDIDQSLQKIRTGSRTMADQFAKGGEKVDRLERSIGLLAETATHSAGDQPSASRTSNSRGSDKAYGTR